MYKKALALIVAAAIASVIGVLSLLPADAQQQGPSATRSFDSATVAPGGELTVTINASGYGQAGGITESLPPGFTYVSTTIENEDVTVQVTGQVATGQTARFTLSGENSFTYTVSASDMAGTHSFSGTLRDDDRNDHDVGGD